MQYFFIHRPFYALLFVLITFKSNLDGFTEIQKSKMADL